MSLAYKGSSQHLVSIYDLWRELGHLSEKDGLLDQTRDRIEKIFEDYYLPVMGSSDHKRLRELRDSASRLELDAQKSVEDFRRNVNEFLRSSAKATAVNLGNALNDFDNAAAQLETAVKDFASAEKELLRVGSEIQKAQDESCKFQTTLVERTVREAGKLDPVGNAIYKTVKKNIPSEVLVCPQDASFKATMDGLKGTQQTRQNALKTASMQRARAHKSVMDTFNKVVKIVDDVWKTKESIATAAFDLHERINKGQKFAVKNIVQGWQKDIELTLDSYFIANAHAIRLSMVYQNAWPPLKAWLDCDASKLFGLPLPVAQARCDIKNGLWRLRQEVESLKREVTKLDPIADAVIQELDKFEAELKKAIDEAH
jgi:hypothetical protein